MADKQRITQDTVTGLALQRSTATIDPNDHNVLASLRARDGAMLRTLTPSGIVAAGAARCTLDSTNKRVTVPDSDAPILALVNGIWVDMGVECHEAGSVDSGTAALLTDTGLSPASDNFWKYAWVVFTSGVNIGLARQVSSYNATLHQLNWDSDLPSALSAGDTFVVTFFYVEDVENGDTNYVFMSLSAITAQYGIAEFYANTTGTGDSDYDLLISTMVVSAAGVWSAVDNSPTGTARKLYPVVGRYDPVQSVTIHSDVPAAGTVNFYATHDQMAYIAGLEVSLSDENFSYTIEEHYEDDRVRMTITNGGSYVTTVTVTLTRKGSSLNTLT